MFGQPATHLLWHHFKKMNDIPRASKKEAAIRAYYREYAKTHGLGFEEDAIGNVLITKPATSGYENAPKIVIQGHMDMVCQKRPTSAHNFDTDPIALIEEDGWIRANDTTLGADNGIGVSAGMAILEDDSAVHGPMQILITVDEEAGMGGVRNLELKGLDADYLLNLDSMKFGKCCVGCAGGVDILMNRELADYYRSDVQGLFYGVTISGLQGGHSGVEIHKGLGSANQLLAEFLTEFSHAYALRLVSFKGGELRNAITRDATAVIAITANHKEAFLSAVEAWKVSLKERFVKVDEGVTIEASETAMSDTLDTEMTMTLLDFLTLLPHGPIRQSALLPVVETSCNIGVIELNKENGLHVGLLARSLNTNGLDVIKRRAKSLAYLANVVIEFDGEYPAWEPDLESKPLQVLQETYRENFNDELQVQVIHAGLETGLIGEQYPHLQMVSFGPDIVGAHSPDEKVNIESVDKFYTLLKALLANLK